MRCSKMAHSNRIGQLPRGLHRGIWRASDAGRAPRANACLRLSRIRIRRRGFCRRPCPICSRRRRLRALVPRDPRCRSRARRALVQRRSAAFMQQRTAAFMQRQTAAFIQRRAAVPPVAVGGAVGGGGGGGGGG